MKKVFKTLVALFSCCIGLGVIVSKIEKKKGWVKGHNPYGIYEKHFKRPLDFGAALFAITLLWPFILLLAFVVKRNLGSPVLFEQERPGVGGIVFKLKKFRSMTDDRGANGELLSDEKRITEMGQLLRQKSLDEIPELVNIIKGDMSFVGPRPLLVKYLDRYSEEQAHRHDVRPGLTGYAQTEGRNLCSWDEKFKKDVEYVKHITFFGDIKILLKTVVVVLKREGISSETSATMEEFLGNNQ